MFKKLKSLSPRVGLTLIFTSFLLFVDLDWTMGQDKKKKRPLPAAERILLESKDGVELRAQWFGGVNGKKTLPIILVHDWDSDRSTLSNFAARLQKDLEAAVIVPDLRGHGESMTVKGGEDELDRNRFKKNQLLTFVNDIDACRRFLQTKNDEGELNLDLLTVIACGKSSVHGVNWCIEDWSWQSVGGVKQGQNVKALVMVSPRKKFKSVSISQSLKAPLYARGSDGIAVLVVYGEGDPGSAKDGATIHDGLKKSRKEPTEYSSADERNERQTVYEMVLPTNATSTDLVNENSDKMINALKLFLELKVLAKKDDYAWQSRAEKD